MKVDNVFVILLLLIVSVLFTTCAIGGTFAKYTSGSDIADGAYVAKWDVQLNGSSWDDNIVFNLFNYTDDNLDVGSLNSEKLVAPGTEGVFDFSVKNNSDVSISYSIEVLITNSSGIPIEYKIGNGSWELPVDNKLILADDKKLLVGGEDIIPIEWRWVYTGDESSNFEGMQTVLSDTELGINGNSTVIADASIKAEQIN